MVKQTIRINFDTQQLSNAVTFIDFCSKHNIDTGLLQNDNNQYFINILITDIKRVIEYYLADKNVNMLYHIGIQLSQYIISSMPVELDIINE